MDEKFNMFVMAIVLVLVASVFYQSTKPLPYEFEGSCNTGFIGVDFQSDIKNQPYLREQQISSRFEDGKLIENNVNFTVFNQEFFPKVFNVKNIDGLNCNFKVKGELPQSEIKRLLR